MNRKLTQAKKTRAKRASPLPQENSSEEQTSLPLRTTKRQPQSKRIFQLKSELHRLQQRDREWKLMFNMLSHDLKEPLLTLEGFTKLLMESEPLSSDQKRYLKVCREAVSSLHLLIGSLQSISRLYQESDQFSDISLKQLIESVTTTLSEQIQKNNGTIIGPKHDLVFKGDPVRLYQVFLNLIANSLKYHRHKVKPEITIKHRKDKEFYRITIQDNGVGIDKKHIERIFAPFTRLDEVPTDGVGIGLSIVKRIAESFGGKITVRSQQNKGTSFTVCLPRKVADENLNH